VAVIVNKWGLERLFFSPLTVLVLYTEAMLFINDDETIFPSMS